MLIQDQRSRQTLTQNELAEQAGLSPKYIGEVERGEANLTIEALERIAEALRWQPFGDALAPVSAAARALLLKELRGVGHGLHRVLAWLETLDVSLNGLVPWSLDELGNRSTSGAESRTPRGARSRRERRS
jgi:transcriptional regulator with XRE-family HTH domain